MSGIGSKKVHGIIHVASAAAAAVGAGFAQLPGSDAAILVVIQSAMIVAIAEQHGQTISKSVGVTLVTDFAATTSGRAISQFLVGWIPGWGNTINATTAAGITEAIGWAADAYFAKKENPQDKTSAPSTEKTTLKKTSLKNTSAEKVKKVGAKLKDAISKSRPSSRVKKKK